MKRILSLALVFCLIMAVPVQAESFRNLKKKFMSAVRTKNASSIAQALRDLAGDNSRNAVSFILNIGLKSDNLGLNDEGIATVFDAALEGLRGISDRKAVQYMIKTAKKTSYRRWRTNIILIDVLKNSSESGAEEAIVKNLKHRKQEVVMAAIAALKSKKSTKAVPNLIDVVEKYEKKKNLPWIEARRALLAITGQDLDTPSDWRKWWSTVKNNFTPGSNSGGQTVMRKRKRTPNFFGTEIHSKRMIFIIDVSGSMQMKDPPSEGGSGGTYAPRPTPGGQANLPEARMRIRRAQAEMIKVVKMLGRDVRFNIITFSNIIKVMDGKGLVNATSGNKARAIKFIQGFNASGATWTRSALKRAFKFKEANTIILASDGSPTPESSLMPKPGQPNQPQPMNPAGLTDGIIKMVKAKNKFRRVRIHTLAFVGANVSFMKRLATENGGKYRDIK